MDRTVAMSSANGTTSWETEQPGMNLTGGPSAWAAGVGSALMLAFFVEGVVGTCWILVALLRVAELRRSVVNVFVVCPATVHDDRKDVGAHTRWTNIKVKRSHHRLRSSSPSITINNT